MHFRRAPNRRLYVVADIFRAHHFFELGLVNQAGRLFARAAQDQRAIRRVQFAGHFFDRKQSGGIKSGHVTQAENNDGRQGVKVLGNYRDFVGGAEQKWSMNAEDRGVIRNVFVLQDVDASVT
jgi:hypothetical protein